MARAAIPRRLSWTAARVTAVRDETPAARTLVCALPDWPGHLPGQHVDIRLTAEDGYRAHRSYSLASAPAVGSVELTVQRVPDGEVSPYLTEIVEVGDELELRGPLGGWFVWRAADASPVLLVAGGSGIVPLMSMIRARRAADDSTPFHLVYSVRTPADLYYRHELADGHTQDAGGTDVGVDVVYSRRTPPGWPRPAGRLTADDLAPSWDAAPADTECFVCGPTGFVETAAGLLVGLGHDPNRIRTERFGPTGG